jgi:hypothetical protein
MKEFIIRILCFILGFSITFGILIFIIVAVNEVSSSNLRPRGGIFIPPIIVGIHFFGEYLYISNWIMNLYKKVFLPSESKNSILYYKLLKYFSIIWTIIVCLYVALFEPYGYMHSSDVEHMMKVIFFPIIILIIGYVIYVKFFYSGKK